MSTIRKIAIPGHGVLGYVGSKIVDRAASIGGNGLRSSGGQMNRARRYKQP